MSPWAAEQARLLRVGRFADIDVFHITREIEKIAAQLRGIMRAQIEALIARLVVWKYLPGSRLPSWKVDVEESRHAILNLLAEPPSFEGSADGIFADAYEAERRRAASESGIDIVLLPAHAPFSLHEALYDGFLPLEPDLEAFRRMSA